MRRLTWLQEHLAEFGNASAALVGDEPTISRSSRFLFSPFLTFDQSIGMITVIFPSPSCSSM